MMNDKPLPPEDGDYCKYWQTIIRFRKKSQEDRRAEAHYSDEGKICRCDECTVLCTWAKGKEFNALSKK